MNNKKSPRAGFTLIELLTVIAIIGILAAILIPTVGAVKKKAAMVASANNLGQVAKGYANFTNSGNRPRTIGRGSWSAGSYNANNVAQWAQVVAEFGDLNDAPVYFITSADDVATLPAIPNVILTNSNGTRATPTEWTAAASVISYNAAAKLSINAQAAVTPLIWTKGINDNGGSWDTDSPWLGEGGHIAFVDGHVTFYKDTSEELVTGTGNGTVGSKTGSISQAIGANADILRP